MTHKKAFPKVINTSIPFMHDMVVPMHVGMLNQSAKTEMTNAFDLVVDARYLGQMMSGFEKNIF